jgi:hypothetical protein
LGIAHFRRLDKFSSEFDHHHSPRHKLLGRIEETDDTGHPGNDEKGDEYLILVLKEDGQKVPDAKGLPILLL